MDKKTLTKLLIAVALVVTPLMAASFNMVDAARLSDVKDQITDSRPSALTDHVVTFNATSGVAGSESITVDFDSNYTFGSLAVADIAMTAGTCGSESSRTLGSSPSGAVWGVVITGAGTNTVVITSGTDTIAADSCVTITIGGTNQVANPATPAIYDLDVITTQDTGVTKLAVVNNVVADVTIDETLTFTVNGQLAVDCETDADVPTTSTSVSFGSVNANTFVDACQELVVSTNATGGYNVTLQNDSLLTSVANDTILAGNCDGGCGFDTEAAWATQTNNGFGYCLEDVTNTDGVFTNDCAAGTPGYRTLGILGTNTPEIIMSNLGVVSGSATEVNYRISVDGAQPAGTYSNEIIYVATPTY